MFVGVTRRRPAVRHAAVTSTRITGASILAALFSSGCHSETANKNCLDLIYTVVQARVHKDRDGVIAALEAPSARSDRAVALTDKLMSRDESLGGELSRRRYLSNVGLLNTGYPNEYYHARIGFKVQYRAGETWEDVICETDGDGTHPQIVDIELGQAPVPSSARSAPSQPPGR